MARPQCPGCTAAGSERLVALDGDREIRRCEACDLVFAHPMPSGQEIAEYYQGFAFGLPSADAIARQTDIVRANVARIVDDLAAVRCSFGSALDFGGGMGFYSNGFADHFETVDLFDLDRVALDHARALFPDRFGLQTTEPGQIPQFQRTYDLIFANQVIEHYTDLGLFFATLRAAAHENTIFVITTPNNRSANHWVRPDVLARYSGLGAKNLVGRLRNIVSLTRASWACCDPPRHVFAFDPDNLRQIAERHALSALHVSTMYCTDDYYSPAKYRPVRPRDLKTLFWSVANPAIRRAVRLMRRFDRTHERGDDIVLLARLAGGSRSA